ncbi:MULTISPECIES: peptidylprolyl isomerase [Shewanella]|uniref:Peptidyl-prolyl cis-trans isomerase n=3 Tax=Bacteria TaxID=2 RepID=A0A1S2AQ24_9GAMM|nr:MULTISPECIES: peptidylprolyl isomerase [Shewanella]AXQ15485.1 peptidylprolyl isomerase [Shewanella algae]AYV13365.1 peptidyl-prolyl cis-trans isomerase [Shewanella algae]EKT4486962.1 peptidyl-prolyl cis-trans isomerase [Shewanella algae]MBC8798276.1 peptidyl-prolyl cis-trans isomerase [Shewanella algae]MBO2547407.1 peptidyl-prolyl cis-trans isomerase [Shewanella algae]
MITLHTNHGDIKLALDSEKAPLTAANFIKYAQEGFYDGTIFHRVIDGFMVQGGGFTEQMSQKPTNAPVRNEANNGLSNKTGTIAMARTSDPHSATAQFFINVNDNTFLDFKNESIQGWGYCVFGEVVEGMDVVNAIKGVSTGNHGMHQDVPLEAVIIEKVTIAD